MKRNELDVVGVYVVTNTITDEQYVGESLHVHRRLEYHKAALRRGKHENYRMQQSATKHGVEVFSFTLLEECAERDLYQVESKWIAQLRPVFNRLIPADIVAFAPPAEPTDTTHKPKTTTQSRALIIALLRARFAALEAASASIGELIGVLDASHLETEAIRDALQHVNSASDILSQEGHGWNVVQALNAM